MGDDRAVGRTGDRERGGGRPQPSGRITWERVVAPLARACDRVEYTVHA